DLLKRQPDDPRVLVSLGILAHDKEDLDLAEKYLLRGVDSPLTRHRATNRLAQLYQQKGDPAAAERYRLQAQHPPRAQGGPGPVAEEYKRLAVGRRARLLRAEFLLRANATNEAVAMLRQLLEDHPDEPEASVKLGMALAEQGHFREAEQVLRD